MGYFRAPEPCPDDGCKHADCYEFRRLLEIPCLYCKEKVKAGDQMYLDAGNPLHTTCVWAAKSQD